MPGASARLPFSTLQWNLRGLLHHNRALRARKLSLLYKAAKDRAITVVQEVHGSIASVMAALHRFEATFHIFFSGCLSGQETNCADDFAPDGGSGGLLFLVHKQQWSGWHFTLKEFCPGRAACLFAKLQAEDKFQQFF